MPRNKVFKIKLAVVTLTSMALLATGCASPGGASAGQTASLEDMEPVTITVNIVEPEASESGQALMTFTEEVSQKTEGKISFDVYFSSALVPPTEMLSGVGSGVVEMGTLLTPHWPQELPVSNWFAELGSLPTDSFPHGIIQSSAASHEMFQSSKEIQEEFHDKNVKVLTALSPYQSYDLFCTKPVDTAESAAGLRTRAGGPSWIPQLEALGMTSVSLPVGEMYEALQRGVVDCVSLHPIAAIDLGIAEVAKHYTPVKMSKFLGKTFVINNDLWDSLPFEAQEIIQDAAHTQWVQELEGSTKVYEKFATETVDKFDMELHDPRELDTILEESQQATVDQLPESAPDAVSDPQDFITSFEDALSKWETILVSDLGLELNGRDPSSILDVYGMSANDIDWTKLETTTKSESFDPYMTK